MLPLMTVEPLFNGSDFAREMITRGRQQSRRVASLGGQAEQAISLLNPGSARIVNRGGAPDGEETRSASPRAFTAQIGALRPDVLRAISVKGTQEQQERE